GAFEKLSVVPSIPSGLMEMLPFRCREVSCFQASRPPVACRDLSKIWLTVGNGAADSFVGEVPCAEDLPTPPKSRAAATNEWRIRFVKVMNRPMKNRMFVLEYVLCQDNGFSLKHMSAEQVDRSQKRAEAAFIP